MEFLNSFWGWTHISLLIICIPQNMKTKKYAVFVIQLQLFIHYHPQCSCGKVMFSQASVILFTGGRGGVWQTAHEQTPRQTPLPGRPPWADTPSRYTPLGRHPPGQTPPARHPLPSACWDAHPPCPVHAGSHCIRWYASYWNAFLLSWWFLCTGIFAVFFIVFWQKQSDT